MLTTNKIKGLRPSAKRYIVTDSLGLGLEIHPSGRMSWRVRYRLHGRPAKINIGQFPCVGLAAARAKRNEIVSALIAGESPIEKRRKERLEALRSVTVREFAMRYYGEVVLAARKEPKSVLRYLNRDIFPAIGALPLGKIDAQDMQGIFFPKKNAGHAQAALAIRNLLKRIWDYAIVCGAARDNPAKATPAKFIAKVNQRTRTLSEREIGQFLRGVERSEIAARYKAALQLILLTLVRKSELRKARWENIDLDKGEWLIPKEDAKNQKELLIVLSRQAIELFGQLNPKESGCVLARRASEDVPISPGTLNKELRRLPVSMAHYTIHDLRRTGSTRLNEMEFNELWVEKALNHSKKGVSGIYNRAEYSKQRGEMLQAWADHLDSLRGLND